MSFANQLLLSLDLLVAQPSKTSHACIYIMYVQENWRFPFAHPVRTPFVLFVAVV